MKKKFRAITIDGESWGWKFSTDDCDCVSEGMQFIKIWRNKKIVFEKAYRYNRDKKHYKIRPSLIARFIKTYLQNA